MQLVLTREEELKLLTPEQTAKLVNLGRDKVLELFAKGEIKTIITAIGKDEDSKAREYRRTTLRWLQEWQERVCIVEQPKNKIFKLNNKKPGRAKYPVGMLTSELNALQAK